MGKMQWLGPIIARRRTPKVLEQYKEIGGSPQTYYTDEQGKEICKRQNTIFPNYAPFIPYTLFRYVPPMAEEVLYKMKDDGIQHAIAFSQYPMYSCTTTGSSLVDIWSTLNKQKMNNTFTWSVIDRWNDNKLFIKAIANCIREGLDTYTIEERPNVTILFSAHSQPMKVVNRGDQYVQEVCTTTQQVMKELGYTNPYILSWQSKVGYMPWMVPSTADVIQQLHRQGIRKILCYAIAFTADNIETLYEIDHEYAVQAMENGIDFRRAPQINSRLESIDALVDVVRQHLVSGAQPTPQ